MNFFIFNGEKYYQTFSRFHFLSKAAKLICLKGKFRICTNNRRKDGYVTCNINREKLYLHRLMLMTFKGNQDMLHCDHLDRNRENNNIENLEWVTQRENNIRSRERAGTLVIDRKKYNAQRAREWRASNKEHYLEMQRKRRAKMRSL